MASKKFLIIGMARSGTTSLGEIFSKSGLDMWREPARLKSRVNISQYNGYQHLFNGVDYTPHGTLDFSDYSNEYITDFWSKFFKLKDGIKHIINGTQTKITLGILRAAKRHNAAILFLYRRDIWASILSMHLAKQTGVWQLIQGGYHNYKSSRANYESKICSTNIDPRVLIRHIKGAHRDTTRVYNEMCKIGSYGKIYAYEDLYCDDEDQRRQNLYDICEFCQIYKDTLVKDYAENIFVKSDIKQTSSDVWDKVPNIDRLLQIKEKHSDICTINFE